MKAAFTTFGLVCLMLLSACSIGGSDSDDPTATVTAAATESASPTATAEATETPAASPTTTSTRAAASPTETATGESASPEATQAGLDPKLAEEIDEIEQRIEKIRKLDLLKTVPISVISREQLRQNLIDDVNADYSQEEADEDTQELWLLRLIDDPTLDLYQFQIDLLSEQVLGYYDPERDEMFIVSDEDGLSGLAKFTLSHELDHALQDQYYDLQKVRFYDQGDNDRDTAAVALIEGDAELAQTAYAQTMDPGELVDMLSEASSLSSEVVDNAPPYLRESLYFPYDQGLKFVQTLYAVDGDDTLNQAFTDPPRSTEQILHPEKYLDQRDDPQAVELPDLSAALGAGWEQRDTDSLGEFDLSVLLRENGAGDYAEAAAGWDGGRYAYYAGDSGSLVAVKTVWDSPDEATEFYDAMLETLAGPLDGEIGDAGQGRYLGLREVDGAVWFISSTDRATVESALTAIGE
ncbi:MAG TPA: hypothetical protein VFV93_01275 [Thermomicrobiales bacterium]|nr:hypothetical protein [Thermomicrobiales bacterium]